MSLPSNRQGGTTFPARPLTAARMGEVRLQPIKDRQDRVVGFESLARFAFDSFIKSTEDAIARLPQDDLQRLTRELLQGVRIRCMLNRSYTRYLHDTQAGSLPVRHFVNVEKRSLAESELVEDLIESAADLRCSGALLVVEVTERPTVCFDSFRSYMKGLMRLKEEGVLVALDDYDLGRPAHWELDLGLCDVVKLDLAELGVPQHEDGDFLSSRYAVLGERLYDFIHRYQVDLVAEKIETGWQHEVAKGLPFKLFQGYRLGHPVRM
ncbi:EAL domain-containing protein [Pseudomonas sp. JS3066]|jgi:EAL domain-containing protein (putative c-di-GMP-specific phosphodiesterase class I)|uniref:EAL domain-containing protein n=1 Tax=unclassified Pseudomonas TaxID=196821 RepID=UPI000EA956DE|nr:MULTISPECIES: EAL domain-containing protein [unclassified Pseudomonas]AYF89393.1 EAL domain-containing protein [Pseudomonas sp. DY-1]MDH4655920.1 EAL domain-containing protein [Pseudomonas sp. BN606]MRK21456.1 EAL domain-containing protein [Pseudomonas sp. JG-B]WVK93052.1 EAL domain-containing protein [Pseudomonas sp. JS3066]